MFRLQVAAIICDYCDLVREASPLPELLFFVSRSCQIMWSSHIVRSVVFLMSRSFSEMFPVKGAPLRCSHHFRVAGGAVSATCEVRLPQKEKLVVRVWMQHSV